MARARGSSCIDAEAWAAVVPAACILTLGATRGDRILVAVRAFGPCGAAVWAFVRRLGHRVGHACVAVIAVTGQETGLVFVQIGLGVPHVQFRTGWGMSISGNNLCCGRALGKRGGDPSGNTYWS